MNQPLLSPASAHALEVPSLLALVAELAATDLGRDRALGLEPYGDESQLRAHRARFEEVWRLLGVSGRLVPGFDAPLGELLDRLGDPSRSSDLVGLDLVRLADLVRASQSAAERITTADPACPALAEIAASLPSVAPLVERIGKTLDRRGDVREDASPLLSELRRRIRTTRDRLYRELGDFLQANRDEFSEETIPMRGGRLVLVLASGSKGRVSGLTHGRSGSGKSFYFEPIATVETNNTLQQSVEDEEAEKARILRELVELARHSLPALEDHAAFVGELDLQQAAARFAELSEGRLAELVPAGRLNLSAARHPLLVPELADLRATALGSAGHRGAAVPLSLDLGDTERCLVVTGPNAGGKTVALKTVGLLTVAHLCGLPVPAEIGTRLPFLRSLVATIGDEQDLLADRSTFSGRLIRLKEAWELAGPESLILIDELGSGTDPAEGAALAVSLLEGLLEKGGLALLTTHLTPLAAAALELPGAFCAAMEFASGSGRPTYRLLPGPPGGSEALALARRLGLPEEWLDRAEARLGTEHRDLRRVIAEVERVRHDLSHALARAERDAALVEASRRRLEDEHAELEDERRQLAKKLKAEFDTFRQTAQKRLRDETERLRSEFEAGKRKGLETEAVARVFAEVPSFVELAEEEPEEGPLRVGGPVRHRQLGWEGVLESLERDRAEVTVRGKRLRCKVDELVGILPTKKPAPKPEKKAAAKTSDLHGPDTGAKELLLIGQRVEPALAILDGYLDRALLGGREEVRIVHGHGSGQLKKAVRDHLRRHRAVETFRGGEPNEGGDGATVVVLRG
ncbi:MAG: Smr/MutS family protein [Thermoanaerobaculia bacterium]|nr:Smr/MutS family protein [Thermoanaerobaculia bacterium]